MADKVRLGVYVTPELRQRLKVACAKHDRSVTELLTELIEAWLKKQE